MKNLIFFFAFSSLFFLACNTDSKPKNEIPDEQLWETFKTDFKNVIGKNDMQGLVKLIDFPLEGNFFETNTGKGLSRNGVLKQNGRMVGTKNYFRNCCQNLWCSSGGNDESADAEFCF